MLTRIDNKGNAVCGPNGWQDLPVRLRVMNAQGTVMYAGEINTDQQRLAFDWPAGLYYLEAVPVNRCWRQAVRLVIR